MSLKDALSKRGAVVVVEKLLGDFAEAEIDVATLRMGNCELAGQTSQQEARINQLVDDNRSLGQQIDNLCKVNRGQADLIRQLQKELEDKQQEAERANTDYQAMRAVAEKQQAYLKKLELLKILEPFLVDTRPRKSVPASAVKAVLAALVDPSATVGEFDAACKNFYKYCCPRQK